MCFWCVGSTRWKSTRQSEVLMAFLWPLVDLLHLRPQGHAVPDWAPISHCVRPPGFHFTPSSWWMVPPCTPPPPPTHQRPPNSEPRLPWAWATHLKPPTNNTILRQPSKGHASYGNLPWSNQSRASYISFVLVHVHILYAFSYYHMPLVQYPILPFHCISSMGPGLFHSNPVHWYDWNILLRISNPMIPSCHFCKGYNLRRSRSLWSGFSLKAQYTDTTLNNSTAIRTLCHKYRH